MIIKRQGRMEKGIIPDEAAVISIFLRSNDNPHETRVVGKKLPQSS